MWSIHIFIHIRKVGHMYTPKWIIHIFVYIRKEHNHEYEYEHRQRGMNNKKEQWTLKRKRKEDLHDIVEELKEYMKGGHR